MRRVGDVQRSASSVRIRSVQPRSTGWCRHGPSTGTTNNRSQAARGRRRRSAIARAQGVLAETQIRFGAGDCRCRSSRERPRSSGRVRTWRAESRFGTVASSRWAMPGTAALRLVNRPCGSGRGSLVASSSHGELPPIGEPASHLPLIRPWQHVVCMSQQPPPIVTSRAPLCPL
jgi:hypothetical protein